MTAFEYRRPRKKGKSLLRSRVTPLTVFLVFGSIAVLRIWVVETAYVEGASMADTLRPGDRVLTLKVLAPERFDIVVFEEPGEGGIDIKRVVGMPGDVVSMVPPLVVRGGRQFARGSDLYVNSRRYDEPYASSLLPSVLAPTKVPENSYFVLGDNRDASVDSRSYGSVKADRIRGVAAAVVYPPGRIGVPTHGEAAATTATDTAP